MLLLLIKSTLYALIAGNAMKNKVEAIPLKFADAYLFRMHLLYVNVLVITLSDIIVFESKLELSFIS